MFRNPGALLNQHDWVWGDGGYTYQPWLICPYGERETNRVNCRGNDIFNRWLSRIRVRVEHCIGLLKGRFQSLKGLRVAVNSKLGLEKAMRWIRVCIILHNFAIVDEKRLGNQSAVMHAAEYDAERGRRGEMTIQVMRLAAGQVARDKEAQLADPDRYQTPDRALTANRRSQLITASKQRHDDIRRQFMPFVDRLLAGEEIRTRTAGVDDD